MSRERPDVVKEVYRLLVQSKEAAPANIDPDNTRFGVEPNRRSLEIIIDYCVRQQLIPRPFSANELFDKTTSALGADLT
ncbi:MAG: hypothetical protein ACRD40_06045 [Candidatus Acidiferrales bacterium]